MALFSPSSSVQTFMVFPTPKSVMAREITIGIKRGKNLDQDVTLKFDGVPVGVTLDPASPVIKHGDAEAKVTIKAAGDAALGDFTVKVTGKPGKGPEATNEFKVVIEKK
jgi:hypothetical protein